MLDDVIFKNSYSSGINEPREFFTEALIESNQMNLGLGFFSSSGIRSLSYGFALFIANGGNAKILINDILSEQDKKAIIDGNKQIDSIFEEKILSDIRKLSETLSKEDDHFFKCLSYLISVKRLEFTATVSTKGGLGHDKYGIFTDHSGHKIAFIGSANFSKTALELNGETITVFSHDKDKDRIMEYQDLFDTTWSKDTDHLVHIPMERVKTYILDNFDNSNVNELLNESVGLRSFVSETYTDYSPQLSEALLTKLEAKELEPRFPFAKERSIQKDAYNSWLSNNKNGIFAMATGAGKTVTSLNCALKQYRENGFYKILIVVPTKALALQWEDEAEKFNYQNIVSTVTNKEWKDCLNRYTTSSYLNPEKNVVIITTYATFNKKGIQNFLTTTKGIESFVYIADEVHNLGSKSSLRNLPHLVKNRIGLSATPERIYDDLGSKKVFDFFESKPPLYTYRYTMKQAIDDDILCHYDYYPIFVSLTFSEMEAYNKITHQLRSFIDPLTKKYTDEAEMLLLKRKRIIHKAENKKVALSKLLEGLKDNKKLNYTFVFVPEGYEANNYSECESFDIDENDIHVIDEYADMFKAQGYSYHKYISGIDDAPSILKSFAEGDIQVLLSMKCLDEGVDIPRAANAIFCSSTGNPRQFVQRRGRVLRKCQGKEKATIWDLVVIPDGLLENASNAERSLFTSEVRRIVNFAALADNQIEIMYGELKTICDQLQVNEFDLLEKENEQYK